MWQFITRFCVDRSRDECGPGNQMTLTWTWLRWPLASDPNLALVWSLLYEEIVAIVCPSSNGNYGLVQSLCFEPALVYEAWDKCTGTAWYFPFWSSWANFLAFKHFKRKERGELTTKLALMAFCQKDKILLRVSLVRSLCLSLIIKMLSALSNDTPILDFTWWSIWASFKCNFQV